MELNYLSNFFFNYYRPNEFSLKCLQIVNSDQLKFLTVKTKNTFKNQKRKCYLKYIFLNIILCEFKFKNFKVILKYERGMNQP